MTITRRSVGAAAVTATALGIVACGDDGTATAGGSGGSGTGGTSGGGASGAGGTSGGGTSGTSGAGTGGSVPATCGNGTVEAGEECDEGAETATCDGDCTLPSCGDGRVNEAAGERCEDHTCCEACQLPASPEASVRLVAGGDVVLAGAVTEIGSNGSVSGWALDLQDPSRTVTIELLVDGALEATLQANEPAADLAGICDGCDNGFQWMLPASYLGGAGHTLELRGTNAVVASSRSLDQRPFGDGMRECDIDGGMGAQIELAQTTRATCESKCNGHTQPGRQCRWDDEWIRTAPEHAHCYIKGGNGLPLWPTTAMEPLPSRWAKTILAGWERRQGCEDLCASFANPNRSCRWRDEWIIQAPTELCVIQDAGGNLTSPFVAERGYCSQTCDAYSGVPGVVCTWGTEVI